MSIPNPETTLQPPGQALPAVLACQPHAHIVVQHVLGTEDPFKFACDGANRVTVQECGDITIVWEPGDEKVQLHFELSSQEGAQLDGISVGWRGDLLPIEASRSLTYHLSAPPTAQAASRILTVEFESSSDTYFYTLYVAYPTGGSYSIDPKIYNDGNGDGDCERRPG